MLKIYMREIIKLMKEIKDLNKCRDVPCSLIGRLRIDNMSALLILTCRLSAIPRVKSQ